MDRRHPGNTQAAGSLPAFVLGSIKLFTINVSTRYVHDHKHLKINAAQRLDVDPMQASDNMDALEQSELINHVLAKMPENQRVILTLFYLSELEVDEIAALLKLPSGTVKSRLHTAREAFRKLSVPSEPPTHPQKSLLPWGTA